MSEPIQVSVSVADQADAERIATSLVAQQLAACVQVSGPIESTYRWNDRVETSQEWICCIKTMRHVFPELEQAVRRLHSYEQPEIIAVPIVVGSSGYLDWLASAVKAEG